MIFVITEHQDNKFKPITNELMVFAQRLGRDLEKPVAAIVLGSDVSFLVAELKERKIDRVVTIEHKQLTEYNPETYVSSLKELILKEKPSNESEKKEKDFLIERISQ